MLASLAAAAAQDQSCSAGTKSGEEDHDLCDGWGHKSSAPVGGRWVVIAKSLVMHPENGYLTSPGLENWRGSHIHHLESV